MLNLYNMVNMNILSASQARIPARDFDSVVHHGERLRIQKGKRGESSVYIINQEDMDLLEAIEDKYWEEQASEALKEHQESGNDSISWDKAKKELGLQVRFS